MNDGPTLICYDGSEESRHAIEASGPILGGGPAVVLNTWEVITVAVGGYPLDEFTTGISWNELDRAARERSERLAADGAELARTHGFEPETDVVAGPPAQAIVDTAQKRRAKVIVIGSRGHTGLTGSMLGSVSMAVIHHAPCPVLVVRREDGV